MTYRKSPTLFRTVPFPTPYGLLCPNIGGSQPHPKLQSLLFQERVKLRTSNLARTITGSIRTKLSNTASLLNTGRNSKPIGFSTVQLHCQLMHFIEDYKSSTIEADEPWDFGTAILPACPLSLLRDARWQNERLSITFFGGLISLFLCLHYGPYYMAYSLCSIRYAIFYTSKHCDDLRL